MEAGIRVKQSNFQYNANFYYMGYKDQLVLTGQLNDVGAYIRENVASSYRAGIELDAAVVLSPQWTLGGNVAFSRNKIDSYTEYSDVYDENWAFTGQESITYNNTDIAFSPDVVGSAIIDFKPIKNLELSLLNKYVGQQFLDNAQQEDRSLDAYWTTDFRFVYTWNPGFLKEVVFSGKVNNVFDKLYEPNGYTFGYFVPNSEGQGMQRVAENYYYPMAGTNFMAGISIRF